MLEEIMRLAKNETEALLGEHENLYGYSIGETENRMPVYYYPDYDFKITSEMTNLQIAN